MKRKRPALVFDGVAPPERKRKINARPPAQSPPRATPIPPPTSVNRDEKTRGRQFTQSTTAAVTTPNLETLEDALIQATSRIESLKTVVGEQNRKIEMMAQDNTALRDEIRNLSQTFQRSKRDLQMVENTINKMTVELKTKFEKMLEKSEGRIQGPIDRLLEELGRMRANPPAPVHVSGITTFPPNTPFPAEPATEGEGSWAPREDYIPAGFNKSHYQENYEHHEQPNSNYRGNFRRFRGRGRPPRGGYSGNRTFTGYIPSHLSVQEGYFVQLQPHPSTPTATPLQPAPTPRLTPAPAPVSPSASTPASTLRRNDSYRSQGHAPPPQHPHAQPHAQSYPQPTPPMHPHPRGRTDPPTPPPPQQQRYRPYARPQAYDRDRDSIRDDNRERDRERPPPLAPREHYADHAPPQPPQPQPPQQPLQPPPRSRSYSRDDDRPRTAAAAATAATAAQARSGPDPDDDVYPPSRDPRYADPYAGYSPGVHSEEERLLWTPSDSVGRQQQHHPHQHPHQQPEQQHMHGGGGGGGGGSPSLSRSRSLSRSPSGGSRSVRSPSPSRSRGYGRRGPATEDGRGGRR
ncbi:hypothetical protein BJV78DRAFT_319859 [Lactifluus subvellereus]|nr:hypothetical protein BJV78DRAFT_319859 [Lactifluus subvellereus]